MRYVLKKKKKEDVCAVTHLVKISLLNFCKKKIYIYMGIKLDNKCYLIGLTLPPLEATKNYLIKSSCKHTKFAVI